MSGNDVTLRALLFGEDRTMSKTIKGAGKEGVATASMLGGAFSKLGSTIGGDFGEILDKVGAGLDGIGERGKKMSTGLLVGGSALTGVGAALTMIGSREKQATDQLNLAITNSGHVAADYAEDIERVVKEQENYGHSAVDTKRALQILTQATGDPKRAIADMGTVANVAAAKHMGLVDTAQMLAKVYAGSARAAKEFGLTMDSTKAASAALAAAQKQEAASADAQSKARAKYNTLLETSAVAAKMSNDRLQQMIDYGRAAGESDGELAKKTGLSVSAIIRLRQASDAVVVAHTKYRDATLKLDAAQERNRKATTGAQDAIDKLGQKTRGQASAAVDNWRGKIDVVVTKLGDWAGSIGQKVGPALTMLGPVLAVTGSLMQMVAARNAAAAVAQDAETGATVGQTVAQKAAAVVAKGWAAAQWLLNAALDANPIGLVVLAVAALVAIFIVAWKHSETFRRIVMTALHDVAAVFETVWGWIKQHWPLLLVILTGPIGLAVAWIIKHWDTVVGFVERLPDRIAAAAVGMWDGIKDAFRSAINWIIRAWDSLRFSLPRIDTHIPGIGKIGGGSFGVPYIHPLAAGGIVTRPTYALIGEAGPEAVIPLSRARGMTGATFAPVINVNGVITRDGARELARSLRQLWYDTGGREGLKPA